MTRGHNAPIVRPIGSSLHMRNGANAVREAEFLEAYRSFRNSLSDLSLEELEAQQRSLESRSDLPIDMVEQVGRAIDAARRTLTQRLIAAEGKGNG